ncbi:hypothetical protein GPROT1_03250 [Gammaproteobacteria bacterium]|nr:hypothetical protein GPROT1_03250 [Gammaproteobacteria bacterium]
MFLNFPKPNSNACADRNANHRAVTNRDACSTDSNAYTSESSNDCAIVHTHIHAHSDTYADSFTNANALAQSIRAERMYRTDLL